MSQYQYYQVEGGNEAWKIVPVGDVDKIGPHMYRTILSVSTPPTDDMTKEELAALRMAGPLYFDLDDASSPASTAKHLVTLIDSLKELDVREEVMDIYASGGKGFHLTIAPEVFIEKVSKQGYTALHAIYKEMAYNLSTPSMDFRVYTGRKGRMFRMPNIKRPNGLYKVQLTAAEVREIANMAFEPAEARYKALCSEPRILRAVATAPRAFGLQAAFDAAKRKVDGATRKAAKVKPVNLPEDLPSFDMMLRGEGIDPDSGFHVIAMQVAITAHARGMGEDELIEAAQGLIETHQSDGNRYDTAHKRSRELRRMYDYTEDNPCYTYSAGAIRSLLTHPAPDLAGIKATEEDILEGIKSGRTGAEAADDYEHAGVMMTSAGVSVPTDGGGAKQILALDFNEPTEMVSAVTGNANVIQATIRSPATGRALGTRTFELDQFNSSSALSRAIMPLGQVFTGNDNQARGVYLRLVEKARAGGRRIYVVNREGVDICSIPFHDNEAVQRGVPIFADRDGVLTSREAAGFDDFTLRFVGFPSPTGIYQSDLSRAPRMKDIGEDAVESLRNTLRNLVKAQTPAYMGKLIGWMVACHWRMMFHKGFDQFPLLHVNGAAGAGKTSMVKLVANLHYYLQEPKMLTPSSTSFAIKEAASASASIPLIIDEYKPHEMSHSRHDEFKLLFRDAYNCRETSRGGGTRDSADYRSIQSVQLAAPICFIAEAAESEPAVMERVVMLTLVKASSIRNEEFFRHYTAAKEEKHQLGVLGAYIARHVINNYTVNRLKSEFNEIYAATRRELMLQPGEAETLSFAERQRKTNAKERTVFNYAVLRFGLQQFKGVASKLFGNDDDEVRSTEVLEIIDKMYEDATSSVGDLQYQTIPEWLKVMNTFADMAASGNGYQSWGLTAKKDYAVRSDDGRMLLELNVRACYNKYRFFCAARAEKALFPNELALTHAMRHLPSRVEGESTLACPGGSLLFDLEDLTLLGFNGMP